MKNIKNAKNTSFEIAQKLLQDKPLIKLLLDDTSDLSSNIDLNDYTLERLLTEKYFSVYPVTDNGLKDSTRNTYLIIVLDDIEDNRGGNQAISGSIYVTTDTDHVLLKDCKNRMLEACDLVCQDLDGFKITASGKIYISAVTLIMIDYYRAGYRVQFSTKDQISERAEI